MLSERFSVPELLFTPQDIGLDQAGLSETTFQVIQALELVYMHFLLALILYQMEAYAASASIILTGGNALIPNLANRLNRELRSYIPNDWTYNLHVPHLLPPNSAATYAWEGAAHFVSNELRANTMHKHSISRKDYLEKGHEYCREKFMKDWQLHS